MDIPFIERLLLYGYRKAISDTGNISLIGVEMVKAGTVLDLDLQTTYIHKTCFYNIEDAFYGSQGELHFENEYGYELLSRRIGLRNISDVNAAVCLSGGIDSTLNLAMLSKTEKPPELALTLHSDDNRYASQQLLVRRLINLELNTK